MDKWSVLLLICLKKILEKLDNISVILWGTYEEIQFTKVSTIIIITGTGETNERL